MTIDDSAAIEEHYARHWSSTLGRNRMTRGRVADLPERFNVLTFNHPGRMSAHATICMSQPGDVERIEVHLFSKLMKEIPPTIIEILHAIAHFHRTVQSLSLGHTVNFGIPWQPGSHCQHGLLSLPYLDGPSLERLTVPMVRFLWLVPITPEELQLKKEQGLEALEERFERKQFNYLDPLRPSVA